MKILLTGYTGNLGPAIAAELSDHEIHALVRDRCNAPVLPHVSLTAGSLEDLPTSWPDDIEVIVHAAADTSFLAPLDDLRRVNVEGTRRIIELARTFPRLRKLVHVSTACVCGTRTGGIPATRLPLPAAFLNAYEHSKWEAEELVLDSGLPAEIVRLSIVAGSERDGSVRRPGALHHLLFWLWKGLIPMLPGERDTPVDLISTEHAAKAVADRAQSPLVPGGVFHGCAGDAAPCLGELLDHLVPIFGESSAAWRNGNIVPPMIVDAETFALFERTVEASGDALFRRICRDSRSFLPGLLHPRRYATSFPPSADWKHLADSVTRHVIHSRS